MHDWAINIINESKTEHLIDKQYVLNLLEAHCADKGDYSRKIWTVLAFMVWHQIYVINTIRISSTKKRNVRIACLLEKP